MLVSLKVGFQVIFRKSLVNLKEFSTIGWQQGNNPPHLCKWIFFIGLFVSKLKALYLSPRKRS